MGLARQHAGGRQQPGDVGHGARRRGARIVQMVWDDLKPRDVMTTGAFANAVRAVLAVGGSVNCIKHLQAVATESGCGADVYGLFESLGPVTPVLAGVRPVGPAHHRNLRGRRRLPGRDETVAARCWTAARHHRQRAAAWRPIWLTRRWPTPRSSARSTDRWHSVKPITMLRGTLCPDFGIVKTGIAPRKTRRFSGPAICFDAADKAITALKAGQIKPGHVVVMRGAGVCGGAGHGRRLVARGVRRSTAPAWGEQVAMLTDGHLSGLVCKGLVVAEVSPEGRGLRSAGAGARRRHHHHRPGHPPLRPGSGRRRTGAPAAPTGSRPSRSSTPAGCRSTAATSGRWLKVRC